MVDRVPSPAPAQNVRVGEHVLADIRGVGSKRLCDDRLLMSLLEQCLRQHGLRILQRTHHKFLSGGEGVTGMFLLAESHACFHSYPEKGYVAVDVFACTADSALSVVRDFARALAAEETRLAKVDRPVTERFSRCV